MKQHICIAVMLSVLSAGCGESSSTSSFAPIAAAESALVPPFVHVGKRYKAFVTMTSFEIYVSEIDKDSGWIKATEGKNEMWLNMGQVWMITAVEEKTSQ